jgi:hypothetical protein
LILATPDNGLAAVLYNACKATAKVGDGIEVTLHEQTQYPFDESIRFTIQTPENVTFPLYLRIPTWCSKAVLSINREKYTGNLPAGQYARLYREWKDGDEITLSLPMELRMRQWQVNKNSASVDYGPLTLSLEIKERYEQTNSRETAIGDSQWQEGADASAWPAYEIYPDSPWNYALAKNLPLKMEKKALSPDVNPFTLENVPWRWKAKGRLVPEWDLDEYGLCGVLPYENAKKSDQLDEITLVPMGAARLRITAFPYMEE